MSQIKPPEDESYAFVSEKIKERPIDKKKLIKKTMTTALLAVLFGLIACVTFFLMEPIISNWLYPAKETQTVALPEEKEETLPKDMLPLEKETEIEAESGTFLADHDIPDSPELPISDSGENLQPDTPDGSGSDTETMIPVPSEEAHTQDAATSEAEPSLAPSSDTSGSEADASSSQGEIPDDLAAQPINILSATDYEKLYSELSSIASNAKRSIVLVTSVTSDLDLFQESFNKSNSVSGMIVSISETELCVFSKYLPAFKDKELYVTFDDGSVANGELQGMDDQTGTCLLMVKVSDLPASTLEHVTSASFGSSNIGLSIGRPVIAIGSPSGSSGSMAFGFITNMSGLLRRMDVNYALLTTDIYGSKNASGVLINYSGNIIGLIDNSSNDTDMMNQISAIGITELRRIIDSLRKQIPLAVLGIYGTDISYTQSLSLELPRGVYVNRIELDSPAMNSGIQSSDIITQIGDNVIHSMSELTYSLSLYQPGDEVIVHIERQVQDEFKPLELQVVLQ